MDETKLAQLRMSHIQKSIDFMATVSPASYAAFAEVEVRRIAYICNASPEEMRGLSVMRESASGQVVDAPRACKICDGKGGWVGSNFDWVRCANCKGSGSY
jgi:hypothetical protein